MHILKQVPLSISKAALFPAHSVSMCAAVLLRWAGWSGGVGWGTAGDFAMTTFYSTQHAPICIAEMSLMISSRLSYTLINTDMRVRACVRTQPHKHTEGDARLLTDKINWKLLFMYKRMTPKNVPWHRNTEISSVCRKKSQFIKFVLFFSAFTPFQLLSNYLQAAVFNIDSVVSEQDFDQSLWKHLMKQAKQV